MTKPMNSKIDFVARILMSPTSNILLGDHGVMNVETIQNTYIHKLFKFSACHIKVHMFILTT